MYIFLVELINLVFSEEAAYIYCFSIGVAIGYYLAKIRDKKVITHIDSTCLPDNYHRRFNIKIIYSNDKVLNIDCDNINGKVCKITNQRCKFF